MQQTTESSSLITKLDLHLPSPDHKTTLLSHPQADQPQNSIQFFPIESSDRPFQPQYDRKKSAQILSSKSHSPEIVKEKIKELIETSHKSMEEIQSLYKLLKIFPFLHDIQELYPDGLKNYNSIEYFCNKLQYTALPAGSVLINQKESFNGKIYLVLNGEISLYSKPTRPPRFLEQEIETNNNDVSTHHDPPRHRPSIFSNESPVNFSPSRPTHPRPNLSLKSKKRTQTLVPLDSSTSNLPMGIQSNTIDSPKVRGHQHHATISLLKSPGMSSIGGGTEEEFEEGNSHKDYSVLEMETRSQKMNDSFEEGGNGAMNEYGKYVGKVMEGGHFGATQGFRRQYKACTVIAESDVELLWFNNDDLKVMKEEEKKVKDERLKLLGEIFCDGDQENRAILEELYDLAKQKICLYQKKVVNEGDKGDEFYMILDGKCEMVKTVIYDKSEKYTNPLCNIKALYGLSKTGKEEIMVASLDRGSLLGEEVMFNEESNYNYSIKVTSDKVILLAFRKEDFLPERFKEMLKNIKQLSLDKSERCLEKVNEKLENKGIEIDLATLRVKRPTLIIPKSHVNLLTESSSLSPTMPPQEQNFHSLPSHPILKLEAFQMTTLENEGVDQEEEENEIMMISPMTRKHGKEKSLVPRRPLEEPVRKKYPGTLVGYALPKSYLNSPAKSKEGSVEKQPYPNATSFHMIKEINSSLNGIIARQREKYLTSGIKTTGREENDIRDVKFDFGKGDEIKMLRHAKSKKEYHHNEASPRQRAGQEPIYYQKNRNNGFELSSLIAMKIKEMNHNRSISGNKTTSSTKNLHDYEDTLDKFKNQYSSVKFLDLSKVAMEEGIRSLSPKNPKDMFLRGIYNPPPKEKSSKSRIAKIQAFSVIHETAPKENLELPSIHAQAQKLLPKIGKRVGLVKPYN